MIDHEKIEESLEITGEDSKYILEIVTKLVSDCCGNLDKFVEYIKGRMSEANYNLTDRELDDIIITIPTLLYFVGTQQEKLGIHHDVTKIARNTQFNEAYLRAAGTAGAKKAHAESIVVNDDIAMVVYIRAYNMIKSKIDSATEILQSAKKILTRRISELELTKISTGKDKVI